VSEYSDMHTYGLYFLELHTALIKLQLSSYKVDIIKHWLVLAMMLLAITCFIIQKPQIYYLHIASDIKYRYATTMVVSKVLNINLKSEEV
jgi:hypothetical protein